MGPHIRLLDSDQPDMWRVLDFGALRLRRRFMRLSRVQIFLFLSASLLTIAEWRYRGVELSFVFASIALATALIVQAYISLGRLEARWQDARAGAEAMLSLSWRYSMRVFPFANDTPTQADATYTDLATTAYMTAGGERLRPLDRVRGVPISGAMRTLRNASLVDRIETYAVYRFRDRLAWYTKKSAVDGRQESRHNALIVAIQVIAVGALLARAFGALGVDIYGVASAVGAMNTSWTQIQQWGKQRDEYRKQAKRMAKAADSIQVQVTMTETEMAEAVSRGEEILTGIPTTTILLAI